MLTFPTRIILLMALVSPWVALIALRWVLLRTPLSEIGYLIIWVAIDTVQCIVVAKDSFIYYWATVVIAVVGKIARRLEGDNRLVGILTALGVVIFTLGNALQFLSTYL